MILFSAQPEGTASALRPNIWQQRGRFVFILALSFIMITGNLSFNSAWSEEFTLDTVRTQVKQDHRDIKHISYADFQNLLTQSSENLLILDIREQSEYSISFIDGAVQVSPRIWNATFLRQFADEVKGKTVVFYCSVGVRSSRLASRVNDQLMAAGAKQVYNLDGGIFKWHNKALNLYNSKGLTRYVHPYSSRWSKLLTNQSLIRTAP